MTQKLFVAEAIVTFKVATTVRAESQEQAAELIKQRQLETGWKDVREGESALTHWILQHHSVLDDIQIKKV